MRALLIPALMALSFPVAAQDVIGHATVNDREAVLFSDGTWRYTAEGGPDCHSVPALIAICVEPDDWSVSPLPVGRAGDLAFRHEPGLDAVVSAWKTAKTHDEMTEQERAKALIFKVSPRMTPEDFELSTQESLRSKKGLLPTLAGRFDTKIDEAPAKTVVFSGSFGTRAISFLFADDVSVVVETTDNSSLFSDAHKELHARLLAGITLGEKP